jgi:hypothetical protein
MAERPCEGGWNREPRRAEKERGNISASEIEELMEGGREGDKHQTTQGDRTGQTEEGRGVPFEERMRSQTSDSEQCKGKRQLHGLHESDEGWVGREEAHPRYGGGEVPVPGRDPPLAGLVLHTIEIENDALRPEPSEKEE